MKKLLLAAAALIATPAIAEPVAVTGGKLVLGDGSAPIDNGVVVFDNGRIIAAGPASSVTIPAGTRVIAARGKWVTPGIVAGYSRIGLAEVDSGVGNVDDTGSDGPYTAAIDVSYSVNPGATPIAVSRAGGVTRAIVSPYHGDSMFNGQGAVIDTGSDADPITKARAFQHVDLSGSGAGAEGGSRSAMYLRLEDAFRQAAGRVVMGDRPDDSTFTQADIEALKPLIAGEQIMLVNADRVMDIRNALRLKAKYPRLDMVILGAAEGWMVAGELAAAGVPVLADPMINRPVSFEALAATQSNIGRMRAAGVTVGVASINDFINRNGQNHRQSAGNLVALARVPGHQGVSWEDAFSMITSAPAAIMGLDGEIGSLTRGAKADVVVWSGDPLELSSAAEQVWIDGVEQSLENRMTRLRDRYRSLAPSSLPRAYKK